MSQSKVVHSTFVIEKKFPQSPEKVFAGFADPKKKRRWMGGDEDGFEILSFTSEFKVGGADHWTFRFKDGPLMKNDTVYVDIVPNERIVFTYTMDLGDARLSSSQTTVEIFKDGAGTRLLFTEQGVFLDGQDQSAGREQGTRELLEKLAQEIANAG